MGEKRKRGGKGGVQAQPRSGSVLVPDGVRGLRMSVDVRVSRRQGKGEQVREAGEHHHCISPRPQAGPEKERGSMN